MAPSCAIVTEREGTTGKPESSFRGDYLEENPKSFGPFLLAGFLLDRSQARQRGVLAPAEPSGHDGGQPPDEFLPGRGDGMVLLRRRELLENGTDPAGEPLASTRQVRYSKQGYDYME